MISQVEIKMVLNTDDGLKNVNFFTMISGDGTEEDIIERISDKINDCLLKYDKILQSGFAVALWQNDELFTMTFMNTEDDKKWVTNYQREPTIH